MNTILIDKKGCKMIAHRGVSGLEKENTCAAFVAAGVKSYYGIETDVHVTADGKYFIFHDDTMKNIAGVDIDIEKSNADRLEAVRMRDTDGRTLRSDLVIPTLADYISVCRKYDKFAVLELKNRMEEKHIAGIARRIDDMGWLEIPFRRGSLRSVRDGRIYPPPAQSRTESQLLDDRPPRGCRGSHRYGSGLYHDEYSRIIGNRR